MALMGYKGNIFATIVDEHVYSYACSSLLFVETMLKPDLVTIASHRKDVEW